MFRTILVPLDGSQLAEAALPALYDAVTDRASPSVRLLQIVEPVPAAPFTPAAGTPASMLSMPAFDGALNEAAAAASRYLRRIRHQLLADGFRRVETSVLIGPPLDHIVEAAEGCDLVVIATSGRSGIARAIRGSVADFVVRNTPQSAVLVVRPEPERATAPMWGLALPRSE